MKNKRFLVFYISTAVFLLSMYLSSLGKTNDRWSWLLLLCVIPPFSLAGVISGIYCLKIKPSGITKGERDGFYLGFAGLHIIIFIAMVILIGFPLSLLLHFIFVIYCHYKSMRSLTYFMITITYIMLLVFIECLVVFAALIFLVPVGHGFSIIPTY